MTGVKSGYVFDECHYEIRPGDVVFAEFRGKPGHFRVLDDTGTGMYDVLRPDGSISPMRPSTILGFAQTITR